MRGMLRTGYFRRSAHANNYRGSGNVGRQRLLAVVHTGRGERIRLMKNTSAPNSNSVNETLRALLSIVKRTDQSKRT